MKYLFLILLCVACGADDFKKVERLEGFRVLGIQTAKPEALPGESISDLRVLFSDPNGGGRQIMGTTVSCIDPGIAFGAKVRCDHDPGRIEGSFVIDTAADDDTNGFFTGLTTNAVAPFTIPPQIFAGRSAREQFNGVGYIVIFNFSVNGEQVMAFKRIVATNRGALNTNPTGSAILVNGAPISSPPGKDEKFTLTNSSQETYDLVNVDGSTETVREELQVAWYVSKGELNKPKSFVNEEVKYLSDRAQAPYLQIAVVRDERGGIEFVVFNQ